MGITKARRIKRHLATFLPRDVHPPKPLFALSATPALWGAPSPAQAVRASGAQPDGDPVVENGTAAVLSRPLLNVNSDLQSVQSWIQARAGSLATVHVYQREAHRLLLWLQYECQGALSHRSCRQAIAIIASRFA